MVGIFLSRLCPPAIASEALRPGTSRDAGLTRRPTQGDESCLRLALLFVLGCLFVLGQ